jgi:hypothetical protein
MFISPNPVSDKCSVRIVSGESGRNILELYDCSGKRLDVLLDEWLSMNPHEVYYDANILKTGVYILKLTTNSHDHYIKFTKID